LKNKSIILYLCSHFDDDLIQHIIQSIKDEFHISISIRKYDIDLIQYYSPRRRQYDANELLKVISEINSQEKIKKIALFNIDLFIPILTFIFGQAILGGNTGIVSNFRLRNELYGLKQNDKLLFERLSKVIIHELGHMFGLIHCQNLTCVMHSSTYVEHIDQKKQHFCLKCREILENG